MNGYHTISEEWGYELEIKKSVFYGDCGQAATEAEAAGFLRRVRENRPGASSYCFAYILGNGGFLKRFGDDGEPSGTAGLPILRVMELQNIDHAVVAVTRHFGGIKLGASGLTRAFSQTAAGILAKSGRIFMEECIRAVVTVDYSDCDKVLYQLGKLDILVEGRRFAQDVEIDVLTRLSGEELIAIAAELTNGSALCQLCGAVFCNWAALAKEFC